MRPSPKPAMLKAVLFDLDNTLVDRDRAFHECVRATFSDPAVQSQLIVLDQNGHGDRQHLFHFWEQQSKGHMNQKIFGELLAQYLQPDPGLLEALRALSSRVKLGIITNGNGRTQRAKSEAAGLAEVIPPDCIWISAEVGKAKPDLGIFVLACKALAESPENCLFVGDHEQNDRDGARAAGMQARLVTSVLNGERLNKLIQEELGP
jgi:putative hydrolase of the HAD superfamily